MSLFAIDISRDDKHVDTIARNSAAAAENAAFRALLRLQGQSVDYALKHGGWKLSAPYAARYDTCTGTAHFCSREAAERYYANVDDVAEKLKSGDIHIGRPELAPGQSIITNRDEGRYYVVHYVRVEG